MTEELNPLETTPITKFKKTTTKGKKAITKYVFKDGKLVGEPQKLDTHYKGKNYKGEKVYA